MRGNSIVFECNSSSNDICESSQNKLSTGASMKRKMIPYQFSLYVILNLG